MGRFRRVVDKVEESPDEQKIPKAAFFVGVLAGGLVTALTGGNVLAGGAAGAAVTGLVHQLLKVDKKKKEEE